MIIVVLVCQETDSLSKQTAESKETVKIVIVTKEYYSYIILFYIVEP